MTKTWHRKAIRTKPKAPVEAPVVARHLGAWERFLDQDVAKVAREAEPVFIPTFDILETDGFYCFLADLPGVRQEDLQITRTASRIIVTGLRQPESWADGADYYALERTFGSFSRSFSLPAGASADQTRASLKDGVLTVVVPKSSDAQPSRIPIEGGVPVLDRAAAGQGREPEP